MARLLVHVEGQTEENFVNEVWAPHLYNVGYTNVRAIFLGNPRQRSQGGGIRPWGSVRKDFMNHLLEDQGRISTTMVDYYGLPLSWPGRAEAIEGQKTAIERAATVEEAVLNDILFGLTNFNPQRFVPYVVMHEFEGLLFSDPDEFAQAIERPDLSREFQTIRNQFPTPEDIDDSPETAPSKRIQSLVEHYQKPLMGVYAVQDIGLETIRNECRLFNRWIEKLEKLV